jgi:hypothetical protein
VSRPFPAAHFAALCARRCPGPVATSDGRGEFTIEGLDPDESYVLVAGGRGCVSRRIETFRPGHGDVVVTVGFLYGVELQIVQRGGARLPGSPGFGPPIAADQGCDDTVDDAWRPLVAGLPPAPARGERGRSRVLHVVDSPDFESVGPFSHAIAEPGFEAQTAEFRLPRVIDALPSAQVELDAQPDVKFGTLFVEIRGEEAALAEGAVGPLGTLTIEPFAVDSGRVWEVPLDAGFGARRRFDGVPFDAELGARRQVDGVPCVGGRVTWWPPLSPVVFSTYHAGFVGVPAGAILFRDGVATIVVDLSRYGDVEFEVRRRDGTERRDELTLNVSRAVTPSGAVPTPVERRDLEHFGGGLITLPDAPYVLRVLPPGRYLVQQTGATDAARRALRSAREDGKDLGVEFEITAGAVTRCPLTIDE